MQVLAMIPGSAASSKQSTAPDGASEPSTEFEDAYNATAEEQPKLADDAGTEPKTKTNEEAAKLEGTEVEVEPGKSAVAEDDDPEFAFLDIQASDQFASSSGDDILVLSADAPKIVPPGETGTNLTLGLQHVSEHAQWDGEPSGLQNQAVPGEHMLTPAVGTDFISMSTTATSTSAMAAAASKAPKDWALIPLPVDSRGESLDVKKVIKLTEMPKDMLEAMENKPQRLAERFELHWPQERPAQLADPAQLLVQLRSAMQVKVSASVNQAGKLNTDANFKADPALSLDAGPLQDIGRGRQDNVAPQTFANLVQTRADLPPGVARQIAEAMNRAPDRVLELRLSPVELGSVRMKMTPAETGIMVSIMTERPETLDLMRRNIDMLQDAISAIGFTSVTFDFAPGHQDGASQGFGTSEGGQVEISGADNESLDADMDVSPVQQIAVTGLDMRV